MCFCYDSHSVVFPILEKRKDKFVKEKVLDAMEEILTTIIKKEKDFTRNEGNKSYFGCFCQDENTGDFLFCFTNII